MSLKINPKDNTITIRKVKDSWDREELFKILIKYSFDMGLSPIGGEKFDKWFTENTMF